MEHSTKESIWSVTIKYIIIFGLFGGGITLLILASLNPVVECVVDSDCHQTGATCVTGVCEGCTSRIGAYRPFQCNQHADSFSNMNVYGTIGMLLILLCFLCFFAWVCLPYEYIIRMLKRNSQRLIRIETILQIPTDKKDL